MRQDLYRLNSKRLQNNKSHRCEVSEKDYQRIIPKIEMLKRLSEVERSVYAIFDMNKGNYLMQSDEQKRLFGFTDANANIDSENHYKNIHPDDLAFVLETDNIVYRFFSELHADEKMDYKLIYDFRMKNTEGLYMRYMHQVIVLEKDKNGKSWLMLVITDLLSERAINENSQRRMINIKTGKLHLFSDDYYSDSVMLLTKRETEILSLIAQGYDSINISDKLCISVNTVNNHRQNILRKTRTENTTQALLYCKRLSII